MQESLRERYENVEVPRPMKTIDSYSQELIDTRDDFFYRIVASLKLARHVITVDLERTQYMIGKEELLHISHDMTDELWLKGIQPLAALMQRRDISNYSQNFFIKFPLTEPALLHLETISAIPSASSKNE